MKSITVSSHAYKRAKERLSWKKKTLDRMAKKALDLNVKCDELLSENSDIKYKKLIVGNIFFVFYIDKSASLITVGDLTSENNEEIATSKLKNVISESKKSFKKKRFPQLKSDKLYKKMNNGKE